MNTNNIIKKFLKRDIFSHSAGPTILNPTSLPIVNIPRMDQTSQSMAYTYKGKTYPDIVYRPWLTEKQSRGHARKPVARINATIPTSTKTRMIKELETYEQMRPGTIKEMTERGILYEHDASGTNPIEKQAHYSRYGQKTLPIKDQVPSITIHPTGIPGREWTFWHEYAHAREDEARIKKGLPDILTLERGWKELPNPKAGIVRKGTTTEYNPNTIYVAEGPEERAEKFKERMRKTAYKRGVTVPEVAFGSSEGEKWYKEEQAQKLRDIDARRTPEEIAVQQAMRDISSSDKKWEYGKPLTVWHGTTSEAIPSIREKGLVPGHITYYNIPVAKGDKVYTTPRKKVAATFAVTRIHTGKPHIKPALLRINLSAEDVTKNVSLEDIQRSETGTPWEVVTTAIPPDKIVVAGPKDTYKTLQKLTVHKPSSELGDFPGTDIVSDERKLSESPYVTLYHGTTKKNAEKILKEGLIPPTGINPVWSSDRGGKTFLSPEAGHALHYAISGPERMRSGVIVTYPKGKETVERISPTITPEEGYEPTLLKVTIPKSYIAPGYTRGLFYGETRTEDEERIKKFGDTERDVLLNVPAQEYATTQIIPPKFIREIPFSEAKILAARKSDNPIAELGHIYRKIEGSRKDQITEIAAEGGRIAIPKISSNILVPPDYTWNTKTYMHDPYPKAEHIEHDIFGKSYIPEVQEIDEFMEGLNPPNIEIIDYTKERRAEQYQKLKNDPYKYEKFLEYQRKYREAHPEQYRNYEQKRKESDTTQRYIREKISPKQNSPILAIGASFKGAGLTPSQREALSQHRVETEALVTPEISQQAKALLDMPLGELERQVIPPRID